MAKARSPDSIEAEKLYHEGLKLVEIAEKLSVPAGTVRRWKSTQDWDGNSKKKQSERSGKKSERSGKKKSERSDSEQKPEPKKRGGQKGNKNAVGKTTGAPLGNQYNLKHGGYSNVYWDTLDEDEKELIETMPKDEETMLIEQIQLYSVRERRLMQAINKYRSSKENVAIQGVYREDGKRTFKDDEEKKLYEKLVQEAIAAGERLPGEFYKLNTETQNKDILIMQLENALSTVQSKKTAAIQALNKLRTDRAKAEGENADNDAVKIWAQAVMNARRGENHE